VKPKRKYTTKPIEPAISTMHTAINMALMRTMPQDSPRTIRARTLAVSTSVVTPQVRGSGSHRYRVVL
jgi:hypothetical protein